MNVAICEHPICDDLSHVVDDNQLDGDEARSRHYLATQVNQRTVVPQEYVENRTVAISGRSESLFIAISVCPFLRKILRRVAHKMRIPRH